MAEIFPKPGDEKRVAQALLALADNVYDVRTSHGDGFAFVVPEELYAKFLAHEQGIREDQDADAPVPNIDVVKRRPGRPRKIAEPAEEGSD